MKAIETKYLSATNTRGSRIKATAGGMSAIVPYDHSKSDVYVHFEAVKGLVEKHGLAWDVSRMVYGGTEGGYVFCFPQSTIEA
jgi:hypothetical protein